jgi:hypothetical protein
MVRLYPVEMVHKGSRLKTGAYKAKKRPYAGRAEFFALPGFMTSLTNHFPSVVIGSGSGTGV